MLWVSKSEYVIMSNCRELVKSVTKMVTGCLRNKKLPYLQYATKSYIIEI